MTLAITAILAASLLPGVALAQAKRAAENKFIEACVIRIDYGFEDRGMVRVSVTLAREGTPFRLTTDGFIHSSGVGPTLSLAQVNQWAPMLDVLRDSARHKFEVRFEMEGGTRKVEYIRGLYYKSCQ
jgi:hypothetical protein